MKNSVFEVDVKGLKALQAGKPIWFVVRELIQNAFDEKITECRIKFGYERGKAHITVTDDNPDGFKDLSDTYTLFKDTYKRRDEKKRGRFNFGEKQVICMCDEATIITTTGGVRFDSTGRSTLRRKRDSGSEVHVVIKMTFDEYHDCINYCKHILVPKDIMLYISHAIDERYEYRESKKSFDCILPTELLQNDVMRKIRKLTTVDIHVPAGKSFIYEMGIPICEIECQFDINVQQKVPLNTDRDTVDPKYLKALYAEVLNVMHDEVESNNSSDSWVRTATGSDRISKEAVSDIFQKRYGDKAVIANHFDRKSIDEAITQGYRVIHSSELNGEELAKSKEFGVLKTSSEQFPVTLVDFTVQQPTDNQKLVAALCTKIFKEFVRSNEEQKLKVFFIKSKADILADFSSSSCTLRFNLSNLPKNTFDFHTYGNGMETVNRNLLDLIIHELCHLYGTHYEKPYLNAITKLGADLSHRALFDPGWFNVK